ncbi:TonB-dependent receptor [Halieaceae bacterium IMCC14734]|uniref:TonB-dependent receptor n=1 Tax=Candidatus Litorirhabdus singularis TaxID=2518993 RepID=A0ABT3TEJ4_9GAMM|nr:TonB-dependent receptor [Candidatus Litorirhabdus singularis]MCX2980703.1 TonB-dependent receptor [Candidatus Litorirhabdus singularis]
MRKSVTLVLIGWAGFSQLLFAQTEKVDSGKEVVELEEVIVTANRREENLQEVAISVAAFTDEFFKDSGTTNLKQLEQYTPSLKISPITDSRSTSIRIRGIGSPGTNAGIDPSVGIFIDGVYQGRAGMSVADLMDIQRVEILRGPQGTLYGKNTAAGALNIISKAPSEQFEAEVEGVLGNYNAHELRGMVNVPLGDNGHATRLSGYWVERDGLATNTVTGADINDASRYGLKSRTLFAMDNAGDLTITLDYSENDSTCCTPDVLDHEGDGSSLGLPPSAYEAATGIPYDRNADGFDRKIATNVDSVNDVKVYGVAAEWVKELDNETILTWITAYRGYESFSSWDGDFTQYDAVDYFTDVELDQYSTEFRITSPEGDKWDYQVGVFLYGSSMDTVSDNGFTALTGRLFAGGFVFPDGTINTDTNKHETTSAAIFGQTNWTFSEDWKLTLGGRVTYEEKTRVGSQIATGTNALGIDAPPIAGADTFYDDQRDASDFSPTVSLSWFAREGVMLYASASQGFKSGGFNQLRVASGVDPEFDDEQSTNYELGIKSTWLERRLQVNATVFLVEYEDFQSQSFDGGNITVRNAGSMESKGVELDVVYVPNSLATLGLAVGYNDATYSDFKKGECTAAMLFEITGGSPFVPADCVQDLTDKPLDNAPEWTASTYIQLADRFSNNMGWFARLEYNYSDEFYMASDLDESLLQESTELVNARLGIQGPNNKWEVTLWGRNLLDEEYQVVALDAPLMGGFVGINAPPLTYGLTLNYRTN